jgi:hypothetical protein
VGEMSSADWWHDEEIALQQRTGRRHLRLNPLFIFSDSANLSKTGKQRAKVAMIACGNFRSSVLRTVAGREAFGLIPKLTFATKAQRERAKNNQGLVGAEELRLHHESIRIMTRDIRVGRDAYLIRLDVCPCGSPVHKSIIAHGLGMPHPSCTQGALWAAKILSETCHVMFRLWHGAASGEARRVPPSATGRGGDGAVPHPPPTAV